MTKKKWKKNMVALTIKVCEKYGKKYSGVNTGKFYRDHKFSDFDNRIKSYSDAWEAMAYIRKDVGM